MSDWQYVKPPHDTVVEVERDGMIVEAKAIWGGDGNRPHWRLVRCGTYLSTDSFVRWRKAALDGKQ